MGGTFQEGAEFAGYRILGVLGRGGMGVVYRAEDLRLGRRVALKVLNLEVAGDERFRERFERESRLLAAIEHPNIVDVYHADKVDGMSFLAMRLVDGQDLGQLLRTRGVLEPAPVAHIVARVAAALDAAHDIGLVHRDVKPGNILVAVDDGPLERARVYLTDFGLTKRSGAPTELTGTGQFVGTVDYVAPEQIQGTDVDGRADLYALACVAYECLTGSPPFREARDAAALMAHLVSRPPELAEIRPDLPPSVGRVLARALAKNRDQRHDRCADFAIELAGALRVAEQIDPPPTTPALGSRARAAAAIATSRPSDEATPSSFLASSLSAPPVSAELSQARRATTIGPVPAPPAAPGQAPPPRPLAPRPPPARPPPRRWREQDSWARPRPSRGRARRRRGPGPASVVAFVAVLAAAGVLLGLALSGRLPLLPTESSPRAPSGTEPAVDQRLVANIPSELRASCQPAPVVAPVVAARSCRLEGGNLQLLYRLYPDGESMMQAYEGDRRSMGVERDRGAAGSRCEEPASWPNEGPFTFRRVPVGRLFCTFSAGAAQMEWADERDNVLTSATAADGDGRRLYLLWLDGRLPPRTSTPTSAITPAAQSTPTPGLSAEQRLRRHIRAAVRRQCESDELFGAEIAAQACLVDGGSIEVRYALFQDTAAMQGAYQEMRLSSGVEQESGVPERCTEPETWPNEGPYRFNDTPVGRVFCLMSPRGPTFVWTEERLNILSQAVSLSGDPAALRAFWTERSGPFP